MNFNKPFQLRLPAWADWIALALMSIAAPLIATYIHSAWVFHSDYRLYNAEIGGIFFRGVSGSMPPFQEPSIGLRDILTLISGCGIPAILTFLALLPFRRRTLYRWIIWTGFIALWTWLLFQMEIAIH
jgi:hypothetical protein